MDGSSQRSPAFAEFGLLVVLLEILIEALHIFMIHANRAALLLSDAHYIHSLDQTNVHVYTSCRVNCEYSSVLRGTCWSTSPCCWPA